MKKSIKNYVAIAFAISAVTVGGGLSAFAASTTTPADTNSATTTDSATTYGRRGGMNFDLGIDDKMKGTKLLEQLVTDGTITQETADKITAFMEQKQTERQAEMDKVKAMTDEERKAYFESNKDKTRLSLTDELVTAGIITQTEADAFKAAMPQRTEKMDKGFGKGHKRGGDIKGHFNVDGLVTDGIITQETADKITAYMEKKQTERQAEMEKVKAMTDEERKAYFESNKDKTKVDLFEELVTNGVITQEEADTIKAAVPTPPARTERPVDGAKNFGNSL